MHRAEGLRKRLWSLGIVALFFIGLIPLTLPSAQATSVGFIRVNGTGFTVDGNPMITPLVGVDETTAVVFAIEAYVNRYSIYWGKNMNFPVPDTGQLAVTNLSQLWYAYFWFCAQYSINLVRFSSADAWATEICYAAWRDHPTQYYAVLDEMTKQAYLRGIYIQLNMAGSQDFPYYSFGASDSVINLNKAVGHAYHNYLDYLQGTMNHMDASPYTNTIFSYDVWNEPDHDRVNTAYWHDNEIAFRTWARVIANDTTPMSTHIVEMGIVGQGSLFHWGFADFYNSTGSIGFDVCDRHYYASAEDAYLVSDPIEWADDCGKPLVWSELANNSGYLHRWSWFETKLVTYGSQAWCNMVLTGTSGYPYTGEYPIEPTGPPQPSPSITIYANRTNGQIPLAISFTSSVSGGTLPYTYSWNFDDGTTSTSANPSHTFTIAGTYHVHATASGGGNGSSNTITVTASNSAPPPSIISAIPSNGATNVAVAQQITLVFSEAMDKTETESAFSVQGNGATVGGSIIWEAGDNKMVFSPSKVLDYNAKYFTNVSTGAKDVAGNPLQSQFSISFITKNTNDTTPPTVTDVYPSSGTTGVSTHPTIIVTFSETMDVSVTSPSIHLSSSEGVADGDINWTDFNTTALFIPSTDLFSSKTYTITVEQSARDLAGNNMTSRFTSTFFTKFNVTDTTKPTIHSTVPLGGSTGVEITQNVAVFFNERMNKTSVEAAFSMQNGSLSVGGSFSWDSQGTSCIFTPYRVLGYSSTYIVTIGATAKDVAGNMMAPSYSLSFTTKSSNDVLPPTVTDVYPSNGATDVSTYATIVITFSEWMNISATANAFHLSSTSGDIPGTVQWTNKNTTLIFTPSTRLQPSTEYTVSVGTSASDLKGNRPTSELKSTFVTMNDVSDTSPPVIEYVQSGNAEVGSTYYLTANVTDVSKLASVTLALVDVAGAYHSIAMGLGLSFFDATIPAQTAPGTVRYTIRAQDEFGNAATSVEYALRVLDTTPPSIRIVSPSSGTIVSSLINIETVAKDNHDISSVEFFVDDVSVLNDSSEPYVLTFNPRSVVDGYHTIRVVAYDLTGLSEHDAIQIVVQNLDVTPPTVKRVSPANGAVDVEPTASILVEFSETMYASSTESAISLETNGTRMDLNITWLNGTTLTISLSSDLDYSSRYWLNITTDAMDFSGTPLPQYWSSVFDTGAGPDIGRPTVLWHSPSDGEIGVSPSAAMSILFSEEMSQSSVESAFSLTVGTEKISGGFKWSLDSTLLEVRPSTNLSDSTDYNMFVSSMAVDLAGNVIDAELRVTFTTRQTEVFSGVSGIVTDGTMPLAGVLITNGYRVANSTQDGRFVFANVPAGSYSLSASKWNYSSSELVKITLGKGQVISGLQFTLTKTPGVSTITGVVFSSSNNTLEGALVSIRATGNVAFTDENGRFILSDVVPGRYSLEVSKLFYTTRTIGNVDVATGENSKIVSIDLSSNPNSGSTSDISSGTTIIGDFTIPIAVGAGVLALAGGMVMRRSWRPDRKEALRRERILRDISGQNGDGTTLEGLEATPRVNGNAAADPDFKTLDSLVDLVVSNEPIQKKKVVSILDPKGDEDFVRGLKELERLR